jgi:hypothetical protein
MVADPIFFDYFGFLIWIFLIYISVADTKNKVLKKWQRLVLFFVGVIGVVVDGFLLVGLYAGWSIVDFAWFFDHFGIPVFLFIIWVAFGSLKNDLVSRAVWTKWLLVVIGVGGLLADGFVLWSHYFG